MNIEVIMTKLFLSCKEATYLIEKSNLYPLSLTERWRLNIHVKMCMVCKIYQHQNKLMEQAIAKWFLLDRNANQVLSPKSKEKILEKIKKE